MREQNCCEAWRNAREMGTDNEGFGRLIQGDGGIWRIGLDLPTINFCPWCGTRKDVESPVP